MIQALHGYLLSHMEEMRADLRRFVETESPSDDPAALQRCAALIADRARELTAGRVRIFEQAEGPHVDILVGESDHPPVLILGHFDTVWPIGTLVDRPYQDDSGIARGPGVFDMKAGLVQGLWAVRALGQVCGTPGGVRLLFTSDEEVQSRRSRAMVEAAGREARVVLVLEPSQDGALKTARKGVGRFQIVIRGRAAHAGVDPENGRSAIVELARVIHDLYGLGDAEAGTSVNVGLVSGGTRANVVAAEARAVVDVRVGTLAEADRVTCAMFGLRPSTEGIEFDVAGEIARPPMQRTPAIATLFDLARRLGQEIALNLTEVATGGGSDANFCAALGVPVLDGLGAVGGGAHAADEHVKLDAMPVRAALLAGLIDSLGRS